MAQGSWRPGDPLEDAPEDDNLIGRRRMVAASAMVAGQAIMPSQQFGARGHRARGASIPEIVARVNNPQLADEDALSVLRDIRSLLVGQVEQGYSWHIEQDVSPAQQIHLVLPFPLRGFTITSQAVGSSNNYCQFRFPDDARAVWMGLYPWANPAISGYSPWFSQQTFDFDYAVIPSIGLQPDPANPTGAYHYEIWGWY